MEIGILFFMGMKFSIFCGVGANMMVGGCGKLLYFRIFVMAHDEVQSF